MRKIKTLLIAVALCFVTIITLVSCSNATKSYADKVNNSYSGGNAITYETAVKDLGDECIDVTIGTDASNKSGVLVAVKGLNKDNYKAKLDEANENTKFDFIVITVVLGKCTNAHFASGSAAEVKGSLAGAK